MGQESDDGIDGVALVIGQLLEGGKQLNENTKQSLETTIDTLVRVRQYHNVCVGRRDRIALVALVDSMVLLEIEWNVLVDEVVVGGLDASLDHQCLELVLDLVYHDLLRISLDEGGTAELLQLRQNLEEARVLGVHDATPDLLQVMIDQMKFHRAVQVLLEACGSQRFLF